MYARTIAPILADESYGSLMLTVIIGAASEFAIAKGKACLAPLSARTSRRSSVCSGTR